MNRILVSLVLLISTVSISDAQLFRSGSSGYQKTANGWNYYGKHYELGVDGPVSSTCNCSMCQQLRSALQQNQGYVPQISQYYTQQTKPVQTQDVYSQDIATPPESIKQMLTILDIKYGEYLVDPGCGDARILIEAGKNGARCLGIEINTDTYEKAIANVKKNGLENTVSIINGDARDFSFKNVDYVALFLFPSLIEELAPKFNDLRVGAKVISYKHKIPLDGTVKIGDFYVWIKK